MHLSNWVKYMELDHGNHLSPGIVQFENVQLGDYFYTGKVDITETHTLISLGFLVIFSMFIWMKSLQNHMAFQVGWPMVY